MIKRMNFHLLNISSTEECKYLSSKFIQLIGIGMVICIRMANKIK